MYPTPDRVEFFGKVDATDTLARLRRDRRQPPPLDLDAATIMPDRVNP